MTASVRASARAAVGIATFAVLAAMSLVGFTGMGRAAQRGGNLGSAPSRNTVGGGFRYYLARALGMHVGVDVARGPDDHAIYLIVGSAWR